MKKLSFVLAALLLAACEPAATTRHDPRPMNFAARPASRFNVRDFGATGDGTTLDTRAINAAIDAAVAAGGGIVVLPAGTYASFSIHLQSNITLQIDKGATLVAAGPPTEGPGSRGGFGGGGGGGGGGVGRGGGQGAGGAGRGGDASGAPGEGFNGGGAIYQGDTFGATDPTTLPSASQPARGGNGGGGGRGNGAGGPGGGRNGGAGGGRSNASQPTSEPAASQPAAAYDPPEPNPFDQYQDYGHSHWHNSLLWGEDLHNVAITGEGTIDGRGLFRSASARTPVGNKILGLKNCTGVTLRDITLFRGGHFCALLTGVDNLTLDHVTVDTNRDGFDIDACQHVSVIHCSINSPNDDGLVLKSSYALGKNRPADDVTITDCHLSAFDVGSLIDGTRKTTQRAAPDRGGVTGRIKLGTESNGGFTHITVANCTFEHCRGVALEAVDGGNITDVNVHDVTMKDVTSAPLFVRLGSRQRGPAGIPIAAVSRVSFSNITATLAEPRYASLFSGIPGHPIEDLTLSHLHLSYLGGGGKADAAITPPEQERGYPDPNMFGVVPAYGLYFRHVTGLKASDITLTFDKPDARPAIVLDDVQNATLQNIHAQHGADVPTIKYQAVKNLSVTRIEGIPDQKPTDGAGQW